VAVVARGMQLLRSAFVSQLAGVVVSWQVVFSHRVSGCVWVLGCVTMGSEGPSEQVGGKGSTAGIHGRSPLVCSCSPVIIRHTSHPLFEGKEGGGGGGGGGGFVIGVLFGLLGGCSTTES
jgi:hypothetical protein